MQLGLADRTWEEKTRAQTALASLLPVCSRLDRKGGKQNSVSGTEAGAIHHYAVLASVYKMKSARST